MSEEIILIADNKTSSIKEIISITPATDNAPSLAKATIKSIRENANYTDSDRTYPCRYALTDNTEENFTIELDYTPTVGYDETDEPDKRLIVHYYPNYRILGGNTNFSEFADYDEGNLSRGHWKLPSDWHKLIIDGAMAMLYPELKEKWEMDCAKKKAGQYTNTDFKLPAFLGVSNRTAGRSKFRS